MIQFTSQQDAVLVFLSFCTVGFICALCIRGRRKSLIVQENNQLYIPQILDGSNFAVTRSKTVTRANQISTKKGNDTHPSNLQLESAAQNLEGSYQNITKPDYGSMEPTYVDPISTPPGENNVLVNDCEYVNIFRTQNIEHDSSDYENTEFLHMHADDDDDPDYVNASLTN